MNLQQTVSLLISALTLIASTTTAFVVGGVGVAGGVKSGVQTSCARSNLLETHDRGYKQRRRYGVQALRAAASGEEQKEEAGGGFVNPYTAFRKWQMNLIVSKAENNEKYPEAIEGLMKEPGMTMEKAERLARIAVSDPILYAIERRKEANKINNTPMDYSKISGFFPMEWIMSGDFGWGFNAKKRREKEEEAKKNQK